MFLKRCFDIFFAFLSLILLSGILFLAWIVAGIDTNSNGLFLQIRIGQFGKPFTIYKLRTMHIKSNAVSKIGAFLRRFKIDELPQLLNVLQGTMSIVGPRPDEPGYYDKLKGEARKILDLKPGITSLAAIKYANEEVILELQEDPLQYNDSVLFPDKVELNLEYYYNHTFFRDLKIIGQTFLVLFR